MKVVAVILIWIGLATVGAAVGIILACVGAMKYDPYTEHEKTESYCTLTGTGCVYPEDDWEGTCENCPVFKNLKNGGEKHE